MNTVKGFNDFTGEDAVKRAEIRKILASVFESYGFEPADTPIVEYEEFVKGENANDEAVSDIFKLQDKGKRKLALRYEFTFQLKRLMNNQKLPYKRYQIGSVFRDEPVTGNRSREFTQCDIDIIGSTIKDEAEVLTIVKDVLKRLNINFIISINNRKLLDEILEEEGVKKEDKKEVMKEIDKLDKLSEKEVYKNLQKYNAQGILEIFKQPESYFEKYKEYNNIKDLKKYASYYGTELNFSPSLARGLSYYNESVFEVKSKEMKETITAGGSFMFNNVQSTGISFGLDRLSKLAKINAEKEKILVLSIGEDKKVISIARKLRGVGKSVFIYYGKPSKALEYANSYKINKVIFIGKEEVKLNKFKIKNLKTGKEEFVSQNDIIRR